MRKLLLLFPLFSALAFGQGGVVGGTGVVGGNGIIGSSAAAATVNCGQTLSNSGNQAAANTMYGTPCTTGTDSNGYTVKSFNTIIGTGVAGTTYVAVYADTTTGCGGGLTHCASNTIICSDSTGFTPVASSTNTDTSTAITTSCGTIAANTNIWLMVNSSSGTTDVRYSTTGCPAFGSAAEFISGETAGTWPTTNVNTGASSNATACVSLYLVLQPK